MKKLALLIFTCFSVLSYSQKEYNVGGKIIPRNIDFLGKKLELSGFGYRSKLWMDVYIQALYLEILSQEPKKIVDNDMNYMGLKIIITSSLVSSGKFSRNVDAGFQRSAKNNIESLQPKINKFKEMIAEKIVENDTFNFLWNPKDQSIYVYKNDVLKGTVVGLDFKKAFFSIYLGDNPVDEKLKRELLGL